MAALAGEPFITTRPGHWLRALADRLFASAGVEPQIVCEGNEPTVLLDLISAGLGVGLAPAIARSAARRAPVAWVHLDTPECFRSLTIVWRDDAYLSTAAERLRDYAREYFRTQHSNATSL